jgi:hypothetical protein
MVLALVRPAAGAELRAGFGVAALPAPDGAPLAGYGGLWDRRAEGLLDPPEARALVLEQGELRVALVALDLVIARPVIREPLVERGRELGIDSLLLVATHTHSGPGGYLEGWLAERVTSGKYRPEAPGQLVRAAGRALSRAVVNLQPVRVGAALGQSHLAENRRTPEEGHGTAVPVLRIERASGETRGAIFAYDAHPTVLSPKSRAYSADYVGAARARLAERGWESIFLPGTLGDQHPRSEIGPLWPDRLDVQRAQREEIGGRLAEAVLLALEDTTPRAEVRFAALERWVELPAARLRRGCPVWWLQPLLSRPFRAFLSPRVALHVIEVDGAVLLSVPGEPTLAVGERLRAALPQDRVSFILSHTDDWIGYIVQAAQYRDGGYEACASFYGSDFADWLVAEMMETYRQLSAGTIRGSPSARAAVGLGDVSPTRPATRRRSGR